MNFQIIDQKKAYPYYKSLYAEVRKTYTSFNGMDFFNLRLYKGDFLLLKNRFDTKIYGLFENKKPRILVTHYKAKNENAGIAHSIGAILVATDLRDEEITFFNHKLHAIINSLGQKVILPLNGHLNLGFSVPAMGTNPDLVTFLTSAGNPNIQKFLSSLDGIKHERKFHGMSYHINKDPAYLEKIQSSIMDRPSGYYVEKLSVFNYKKDIRDYNYIINESFKDHYGFFPLTFEEEWDLMKTAILVINRNYFRFLTHNGKRVAVSMFFPDYNTVLTNGEDAKNMLKIMANKSSVKRVRGVNVAILPEYRGKGLIKYVRNENLLKMIKDGVSIIESSYIDEANINSQENVKSTGASPSHMFELYSL